MYRTEDGNQIELDALILSGRRLVGQQIAAGKLTESLCRDTSIGRYLLTCALYASGYPTITIPGRKDEDGMPVGITLQQKAWREGILVIWASAIEDVRDQAVGQRPLPLYVDHPTKNFPIRRRNIGKP